MTDTQTVDRPTRDVHTYFGLSYSNYLVLHRTLLQSMPTEWQHRFVTMLDELDDAFDHVEKADYYEVTAAVECEYGDLTASDMKALGITRAETEDGDVYYDKDGVEWAGWEPLMVPRPGGDSVPHYNRGRTRIEPKVG